MNNVPINYSNIERVKVHSVLACLVIIVVFSQPLSVVLSIITGFSINFAYISAFMDIVIVLIVVKRSSVENRMFLAIVIIFVSIVITYIFSGFESPVSSISYLIQNVSALLLMSYSGKQKNPLSLKQMYGIFFFSMSPSIIVGFVQNITSTPIFLDYILKSQNISLDSVNNVWQFGDKTRAFGLFYTNGYYGFYLIFLITLYICKTVFLKRWRILSFALLVLFLIALYGTYTRTAYANLVLVLALIPAIFFVRKMKIRALSTFIILQLVVGIFFAMIVIYSSKSGNDSSSLTNSQSITIRTENWAKIIRNLKYRPEIIYGYGVTSNEIVIDKKISVSDRGTLNSVIVDNGYMATLISGGIILLAIQIFVQYSFFSRLYKMYLERQNVYNLSALAFYSSVTLYNLFGNLNSSILIIGIALVIFGREKEGV